MRILGALLAATLVLAAPLPAQAHGQPAAKSGRECIKGGGPDRSLKVTGRLSCKKALKIYQASIEYAAANMDQQNEKFRYRGYRCTFRPGGELWYTCRDTQPKRSFTVKYT